MFDYDPYYDASPVSVKNQIVHRDVVAVEVEFWLDGTYYTATGVAKRHPEDVFNREIGTKLAYARAFASIAAQLERQANGAVKHAEDVREIRAKQAAKPKPKSYVNRNLKPKPKATKTSSGWSTAW